MTAATDRRPVALVAAAVVAVVVVALVLTVGVARPPALLAIADGPAVTPPAAVALHGWTDGESCVTVVARGGSSHRPWCTRDGADLIGWTDGGVLLRTYSATGELELEVDPADGEVIATRPARDRYRDAPASAVTTSRALGGGELEVRSDDGTVLWRTRAPSTYAITGGWPSPDGGSVALLDNADRLLIVPADGSQPPRVWAEDVTSWYELAWEGGGRQ